MNTIRRLLTLILVFVASTVFAQDVDVNKINEQLIEAINKGDMDQVVYCCNNGADFLQMAKTQQDAIISSDVFWSLCSRIDDVQTGIVFNLFFADYYKDDPDSYHIAIKNLAYYYFNINDYNNAELYFKQLIEMEKEILGEKHSDYATSLNNSARLYRDMGDYAKAESLYRQVLYIKKESLGENHPDYAKILNSLANLYISMGDFVKAEQLYRQSLEIYYETVGENHPDYAMPLLNLANLFVEMGDYSKAEPLYMQALEIKKESIGENHPDYAGSIQNLAILFQDMGDYARAEPLYGRAIEILKETLGEKHPVYAGALQNLANLYRVMSVYAKAEPLYMQTIEIYKETLGEKHPNYAGALQNLANLYREMGDYSKAEPFCNQALDIYKNIFGENNLYYAGPLHSLANLYADMGDYAKAELLYKQVLEINKETLGENHPDYAGSIQNLAILFQDMGDYARAEPLYGRALEIFKETLGEKHPVYASALQNLANLYRVMSVYAKAEPLYMQAIEIYKETLGEKHPNYAGALQNLANLYMVMGYYAKAEPLCVQGLEIFRETLGEINPYYISLLNNMANLYRIKGEYAKAEPLFSHDFQLRQKLVTDNFDFMSENQRNRYWSTQEVSFEVIYPAFCLSYYTQNHSISSFAYNNELFLKGLLLNATTQVQNAILESEDEALINTYYELKSLRERIMFLQQQPIEKQFGLDSLELVAESLDKDLVLKSQDYRQTKEQYQVTWDKVRDKLKKNEVAIEFSSFLFYPNDSTCFNKIVALLVRKDSEYPKYIELADADTISALLDASPSFIYTFNGNGYKLYQSIWEPISKYLKEGDTVYFSASGILHQINLSAIPASDEKTVGDLYNLVQLSSTREIALQRSDKHNKSAVIYGGLFYDEDADAMALESRIYDGSDLIASRSLPDDSTRVGVKYLNGTKREAEAINELLLQNGWNTSFYTEAKGNEESFKALSGKKTGIMQIATHGFFFTNEKAQQKDLYRQQFQLMGDEQFNRPYIDPLLRSGLLLAGANIAYTGHRDQLPEGVQDGILTAKEISQLDLRGTDLVVLSACETGKGEITSEGVFGLQRAFKQAEVQTIVMSLWKVDDNATSMMMQTFYEHLLSDMSKREAFKLAQAAVRAKYAEPYYWAGFIMLD